VSVQTPRTLLTYVRNPACNLDALCGAGRLLQEGADKCGVHVQYVVQTLAPGSFSAELLLTSTQQVPPPARLPAHHTAPPFTWPAPALLPAQCAHSETSSGRSLRCAQAPVPAWLLAWSWGPPAGGPVGAGQGGALLNLSTPAAPQQFALASLPGAAPLAPGAGARARLSVRAADGGVGQAPLIDAVSMQGLACPAQAPSSPAAAGGQGAAAAPAPPPACGASAPAGAPNAAWSPAAALPGAQPPCALSFCCPPVPALAPSGLLSGAAAPGARSRAGVRPCWAGRLGLVCGTRRVKFRGCARPASLLCKRNNHGSAPAGNPAGGHGWASSRAGSSRGGMPGALRLGCHARRAARRARWEPGWAAAAVAHAVGAQPRCSRAGPWP